MDGDRQTKPRGLTQSVVERPVVRARKLGQPRVPHERLEADDALLGHVRHLGHRAWHEPTPEREVRDRRGLERRALALDLARVDAAGRRVERHVEEQRATIRRQRAATGGRAFPPGSPRLVEVQVHVDDTGHHHESRRIDLLSRARGARTDRRDASVLDGNVRGCDASGQHDSAAAYDEVSHEGSRRQRQARWRRRPASPIRRDGG